MIFCTKCRKKFNMWEATLVKSGKRKYVQCPNCLELIEYAKTVR